VIFAAALLSLSYLAISYGANWDKPIARTRRLTNQKGQFSFRLGSLLSACEVKQANIYFSFDQKIERIQVFLADKTFSTALPTGYKLDRLSSRHFRTAAQANMLDWLIVCIPQRPLKTLQVRIFMQPHFRFDTFFVQFFTLFFFILLIILTLLLSYHCLTRKLSALHDVLRTALFVLLLLNLTIYLYFFLHLRSYIDLWKPFQMPFIRVLSFNLLLAAFFSLLFFIGSKKGIKLIFWPLLMSLLYFLHFPKYDLRFCGDAIQWIYLAADQRKFLYFAEFLSFGWAKGLNRWLNPSSSLSTSAFIFSVNAKIIGVLFAFIVYFFVQSQKDLAHQNKVAFFVASSLLTWNVFFLGYPELSFYELPFLLLSVLFSIKYTSTSSGGKYLYLATLFLTLAGLFHGCGYFSAPVLFLLPFLKENSQPWNKKRAFSLLKDYAIILLISLGLIFLLSKVGSSLGYSISFQNVRGGGDYDMLVDFLPRPSSASCGEAFLEMRYLWERGLGVFLAFPVLFFLLIIKIPRWKKFSSDNLVLFLFGLSQVSVFFLWSFDLGFRDLDLFVTSWVILNLLFMKIFLSAFNAEGEVKKNTLFVFLFALTTQIFFVFFWTIAR